MRALTTRLRNIEKAILPDCDHCRYNRFANLTDEELERSIKDLEKREYAITPVEKLRAKIQEIEDAIEKRKGMYERDPKKMHELLAGEGLL